MPKIIEHLVLTEGDGPKDLRAFTVSGMACGPELCDEAMRAVDDADPTLRVPRYGDLHPKKPLSVTAIESRRLGDAADVAIVIVTYGKPTGKTFRSIRVEA
jgi:hypothetical protein